MNLLINFVTILLILSVVSQSVPESVQITGLPNQTQTIYQGWLCVSGDDQSFLYYQLFLSEQAELLTNQQTPLLLFLEGGPGDSSAQTVWADFGPYIIDSNVNLTGPNDLQNIVFSFPPRNNSWSGPYHVLSIDNPVLTGYSFSKTMTSVNTTEQAGAHLIIFLSRFYQLYPDLASNPLYILGHSYGGHWAPYLAYSLVKDYNLTLNGDIKINLWGVIGLNPLVSLGKQKVYADVIFGSGLTDAFQRDSLMGYEDQIARYLEERQLVNATSAFFDEFGYVLNQMPDQLVTPNTTVDNIRRNHLLSDPDSLELTEHYLSPKFFFNLTIPGVQAALEVFNIPSGIQFLSGYVEQNFVNSGDFALDFSYTIEYLLDQGINVTILGAQDDGTVPATGITNVVGSLNWSQSADFRNSQRKAWYAKNGTVVGNYKKLDNFNYVILYKSGHVTTFDQPDVILEFLDSVTNNSWQ